MSRDARSNANVASDPRDPVRALAMALLELPPGHLRTAFPELSPEEARRWEREFAPLRKPCGCSEAALGLIAALGLALLAHYFLPGLLPASWTAFLVTLGASASAGFFIGKSLGIARGRRRYLDAVSRFRDGALGQRDQSAGRPNEAAAQ
jgi:hypothetical protein